MYLNIHYERSQDEYGGFIHVWDDSFGYKRTPFSRYAYKVSDDGSFKNLYGQKVKRTKRWSKEDEEKGIIYESDVNPEMRYLIDNYTDTEVPSKSHVEMFFDIEVDSSHGLPDLENATSAITAIAYYDKVSKKYVALILDPSGEIEPSSAHKNGEDISVFTFKEEENLLQKFMTDLHSINPTILTGWNIDNFDIPYLYKRLNILFGQAYANELSPVGIVNWNAHRERYFIAGVSCLDYISLYKTFSTGERISFSLDSIGKLEIGMGKVVYEGSLDTLYKIDKEKYIEYNVHDVRIVVKLDEKMKFIELAKGVIHKGHVPLEDICFPSRYIDGTILTYMKRKGMVAPNRPKHEHGSGDYDKFAGAFVKEPIPGKYPWIIDLDATSLYPSIIMSLNISPETKVTIVQGWNNIDFKNNKPGTYRISTGNEVYTYNHDELQKFLIDNNTSISSNGVLYDMSNKGILAEILEKWFEERTEYKNLMKKHGKAKNQELYEYYYNRQYIQKVILNSLYGVLGLPSFRFYDRDNALAVTSTGQDLIKYAADVVNFYFRAMFRDKTETDYVVYIDTDSLFMSVQELIKLKYPGIDVKDFDRMAEAIGIVAREIQDFVNSKMNNFAEGRLNIKTHKFNFKQEIIASSGFWTSKKRYALNIINKEGVLINEVEVTGLDVVRTNFPKVFRDFMNILLKDILNGEAKEVVDAKILDLRSKINTFSVSDIARPTGVKDIDKYVDKNHQPFVSKVKGAPAHVKAAINYNDFIKYKNLQNKYRYVSSGQKIKWVYLKKVNPLMLETLAFKDDGEDPKEILQYIEEYVDREEIYSTELVNKLTDFYDSLGWGSIPTNINANSSKFF